MRQKTGWGFLFTAIYACGCLIGPARHAANAETVSYSNMEWITPEPRADLAKLKSQIEAQGGEILTLAPEGQLLVRYAEGRKPGSLQLQGVQSSTLATFTIEPTTSTEKGLGERPPTVEESAVVEQEFEQVKVVEPNTLSWNRALLEDTYTPDSLPSQVDNSLSMYFPPVRSQGSQGSCTAWACGYYFSTYTQAMDENLNASGGNNNLICSPAFIYNLINDGADNGSSISYAIYKLNTIGCCSWGLFPYSSSNWTTWPTEAQWVDALRRRTDSSYWIGSTYQGCDDDDVLAIKQHLANGNIAVTRTDVYQNWYSNYPADTTGVNNGVLYANSGSYSGGHAMTIVGYDDNKSYFDGSTTRYGAFLIANSWGSWWGVTNTAGVNGGFMWVAYDFFKADNDCFGVATYNSDLDDYRPTVYAVSGLNHTSRSYLDYRGGIGATGAPNWVSGYALWGDGGSTLAIDDTKRVAIDLTDGIDHIALPEVNLFVELGVANGPGGNGTITSADFYHDFDGDGQYEIASSSDPTVTVQPSYTGFAAGSFTWGLDQLAQFGWNTIVSPQEAGEPIAVMISALDYSSNVVTDFESSVNLTGFVSAERSVGTGSEEWNLPLGTYYHDARTQVIYRQSEIGEAGTFSGLALDVTVPPGQMMENWTIRMKHTPMDDYDTGIWEGPDSGWTTVYQQDSLINSAGRVWFEFSTPFEYNGVDNLMVDFSFNNSSWTANGMVRCTGYATYRSVENQNDSQFGDPLTWEGSDSPVPTRSVLAPNLRLVNRTDLSINPTTSGSFIDGVWNGTITVGELASQMVLRAEDGNGHVGESNAFDVVMPTYTLTVTVTNGAVIRSPDQPTYDAGDLVSLSAYPAAGYQFNGWSGDVPAGHETDNPLSLTMDGDKSITANFVPSECVVSYQTDGTPGASLSGNCSQTVSYGDSCTAVTASPPPLYYQFEYWTSGGLLFSTDNPLIVSNVTQAMTLRAEFNIPDAIWVDFGYGGSLEDGSEECPFNTVNEAVTAMDPGKTMAIRPGTRQEAVRITSSMRLIAPDGPVRIGSAE